MNTFAHSSQFGKVNVKHTMRTDKIPALDLFSSYKKYCDVDQQLIIMTTVCEVTMNYSTPKTEKEAYTFYR